LESSEVGELLTGALIEPAVDEIPAMLGVDLITNPTDFSITATWSDDQ